MDDTKLVECPVLESVDVRHLKNRCRKLNLTLNLSEEEWSLLLEVSDSTGASPRTIVHEALRYALQSSRAMDKREEEWSLHE